MTSVPVLERDRACEILGGEGGEREEGGSQDLNTEV